jgi:hypothetical protein
LTVALYWKLGEAISRKQDGRGWAKNLVIFSRCKDDLARVFYTCSARPTST